MPQATPQQHAKFSPSAAHRWIPCPGSVAMEKDYEDTYSSFAEEGTVAHELAAWTLTDGVGDPWAYEGTQVELNQTWTVDQSMIENVADFVEYVHDLCSIEGAILKVEKRVEFGEDIDQPGQFGTADIIILTPDELILADLKYGRGVQVDAEENEQLMLYALGALRQYGVVYNPEQVRLCIFQPRIDHISEWTCGVEHLRQFAEGAIISAKQANSLLQNPDVLEKEWHKFGRLVPGEKQCKFCKARADCPALKQKVDEELDAHFAKDDDPQEMREAYSEAVEKVSGSSDERLAAALESVDLVETWCKAIREEAYRRLMEGGNVPGYKLVEGRRPPRKWDDEGDVKELMQKSMKLKQDDIFTKKLITPTQAEKLLKKESPRRWEKLEAHVTQGEASLSIAPESDKRQPRQPESIDHMFKETEEST